MTYERINERVFTADHPEVVEHTRFFHQLSEERLGRVFADFQRAPAGHGRAVAVGTQWLRFSEYMTRLLPLTTAKLESVEARHYVIQTAFEELGERDVEGIHAERFRQATEVAGLGNLDHLRWATYAPVTAALKDLGRWTAEAGTDDRLLGIALGLEIPAEENIRALFEGLVHGDVRDALRKTAFFETHFSNEPEHIRLSVANFLRFSRTRAQREEFLRGVEGALEFWVRFWTGVTELADSLSMD